MGIITSLVRTKGKCRLRGPPCLSQHASTSAWGMRVPLGGDVSGSPPVSPVEQVRTSLTAVIQFVTSRIGHAGMIVTDDIPGLTPPS